MDLFSARRMTNERLEQVENDIRVEAKVNFLIRSWHEVLYGLQRFNQVYGSDNKTKIKVTSQKEENTKVLNLLQVEAERLNELMLFIESQMEREANQDKVVVYIERKAWQK